MFDLDSALGIEISGEHLLLCLTTRSWQGYSVKHTLLISDFPNRETSELHGLAQGFLRNHSFNRENIILGIPREQVVVHYLELPLEVEENLDHVVGFQAAKFEPNDEESSYFDYFILEKNEKEKSLRLQLVMVPKAPVDDLLNLLRELGLFPAAIRLASAGYQQLFKIHRDGVSDDPSIILRLEENSLEIVVTAGKATSFAHVVPVHEGPPSLESVLAELDLFVPRLRLGSDKFRKVYLCGEYVGPLREALVEHFGDVADLGDGLNLKPKPPDRFFPALGLAVSGMSRSPLSRFNLIPVQKRVVGYRASWIPSVVLLVLLMLMLFAIATREFFQQRSVLAAVNSEVQKRSPEVERALSIRQEVEAKMAELRQLQEMMCGRQRALLVLRELTERIPESAYLQSVNIQREKVSLVGYADNASSLIAVLQSSDHLDHVESRYITQDRRSGLEKFNFEADIEATCSAGLPNQN